MKRHKLPLTLLAAVLSVVVLACAGRGQAVLGSAGVAPASPGVSEGKLGVDGRERSYRLYVPRSLPTGPTPLVIAMHGGLGTPQQFAENSRFDAAAEAHGFVAVYPEGIGRTWNGGRCCGQAQRQDIDDVAFISALIDHLSALIAIDPSRVFATGHSNGGIMAFRLACELSDKIVAIVPVAASVEVERCAPPRAVAVLAIHGDADRNHPIEGGTGPNSVAGVPFASLASSMDKVGLANGCAAASPPAKDGDITTTRWQGCREGGVTEQKVIAGASHAWPGGTRAGSALVGEPTQALNATEEALRFFETHARPPAAR